jgi:hypothetical protein
MNPYFFKSALGEDKRQLSRPVRFIPGEKAPDTHLIGDCVDHRAGLNDVEK